MHAELIPYGDERTGQLPARKLLRVLIHQFSQPLTVLLGEMELALRFEGGRGELKTTLERCFEGLERLSRLVGDLRAAGEATAATRSITSLAGLVGEVLEAHRTAGRANGFAVERAICEDAHVRTDPELLRRALSAIIEQAFSSCAPGASVEIRLEKSREAAALSFSYAAKGSVAASRSKLEARDSAVPPAEWTVPEAMIQVLGGALEIDRRRASRTRIRVVLPLRENASKMRTASSFSH